MIFEPAAIRQLKLRNRFVRSATHDGMADSSGQVTEKQIALYTGLAQGGCGLIVTGLANVDQSGRISAFQMDISNDSSIPGLRHLVDAVHGHGARIAAQLSHAGREACRYQTLIRKTAIAPSVVKDDPYFEGLCREMTEDEIRQVIRAFGDAALRAKEAGFDAVQLHGAHAYLFSQFLSPFTNRRTDIWGGELENRSRFLRETCREIRSRVGADYPLLIKLGVQDGFDKGLKFEEGARVARQCQEWGIDALEISQGLRGHYYTETEFRTGIDRAGKEAYFRDWCKAIKSTVDVPVMMVGGLRRLEQMETIIENREADFVSLCRPLIREPDLISTWEKEPDHRAACISCNRCFVAIRNREPLGCAIEGELKKS
ncbi:MAG: NADH:flavin oxidoreductase [Pseudomonadota bacterium]